MVIKKMTSTMGGPHKKRKELNRHLNDGQIVRYSDHDLNCGPLKACEYQTTESLFSKMFCFSDVWYSDLHCNSVFLEPFFFTKIENKFRHRG